MAHVESRLAARERTVSKWRMIVLGSLYALPVLAYVVAGGWAMWEKGWFGLVWWLLPVFWGIAWALTRYWGTKVVNPLGSIAEISPHWTPRDLEALDVIAAKQKQVEELAPGRLTDPHLYLETALELSTAVARHYHPRAADPVTSLTIPEILAAGQLAFEDLENWTRQYVPGSHLLTIEQWRLLGHAPKWMNHISNLTWLVSFVMNPAATIPRYFVSKSVMTPSTTELQNNLLTGFYVAYVARVGRYCIEMNSGRLRGGAALYRETMARLKPEEQAFATSAAPPAANTQAVPALEPVTVTIALIGQVKAGKSSLVNALIGEQQAASDVLPLTRTVQRFRMELPKEIAPNLTELVLLDTPGYAESGASPQQTEEVRVAARQSDLLLIVMDAKSPARQADLKFVQELSAWFQSQPQLKPPPSLAVITHIDGLSPVLEFAPPYDWQHPQRPKEKSIRGAVDYNRELFGNLVRGVIPCCTDVPRKRVYGVEEWLVPAMAGSLSESRAVALVRTLHSRMDTGKFRQVLSQVTAVGKELLQQFVQEVTRP